MDAVNDYLEQVLAANPETQPYSSLIGSSPSWSVDQALCRFVGELLACPVVDVGVAARRALAKYVSANGKGLVRLPNDPPWWNPLQLEHLLAALHIGAVSASTDVGELREFVESLNHSTSLAVRSVAKRICDEQGWVWKDVTTAAAKPVVRVGRAPSTRHESGMVLGDDPTIGWRLHQGLIAPLLRAGLDADELWSEFCRAYWDLGGQYPWANEKRLDGWMTRLLTRFWIKTQAIIGREAAMRVFGSRSLTGQVPSGAEAVYDHFYPIYDPELELHEPAERPAELQAMEWRFSAPDEEAWRRGANADEWNHYPDSVRGLSLIGERTRFVRPEPTWPYEVRHRGLIVDLSFEGEGSALMSAFALTYRAYLDGEGQNDKQLIVLNHENHHLVGPAYRWAAINSNIARTLGWHPSNNVPFRWLDSSGNLMVESTYWKDGWVWIARPQFASLGEGWFVSASPAAIEAIRQLEPGTEIHLWVERHSHGNRPYEGKWHLSQAL